MEPFHPSLPLTTAAFVALVNSGDAPIFGPRRRARFNFTAFSITAVHRADVLDALAMSGDIDAAQSLWVS